MHVCVFLCLNISSIVLASRRLARRHHSVNEGIKDDANRCRVAIMKHNCSFIRRFKCFVSASQFVPVVRRLLLQLYSAHAHPHLTCYVTCAILPSVIVLQAIVFVVFVESGPYHWWRLICSEYNETVWRSLVASLAICILLPHMHACTNQGGFG